MEAFERVKQLREFRCAVADTRFNCDIGLLCSRGDQIGTHIINAYGSPDPLIKATLAQCSVYIRERLLASIDGEIQRLKGDAIQELLDALMTVRCGGVEDES